MGKLLHKLMHGIVPSWLTKIKASDASPKRLLPFFRRSAHMFSNKSSREVLALMDKDGNSYDSQMEEEKEAPAAKASNKESSATPAPSPSIDEETQHGDDHHHHHHEQRHDEQRPHDGSSKRKRQCVQEEGEEGDGGSSTGGPLMKRRKREKGGVMSSELPECICEMVGNGSAVVKFSEDPHLAFWESMVEMIVGNGLWDLGNLEYLLYCYLTLNHPNLHDTIQVTFLQVLQDLERTPSRP